MFSSVEPITEEQNRILKDLLYINAAPPIIEDTEKKVKRKQQESLMWTDVRTKVLEMEVEDSDGDVEMDS